MHGVQFHPESVLATEGGTIFNLESGATAAALNAGSVGILHGSRSYLLQTGDGQVRETHSVSAGLDYPGVGPEHAYFMESGRATYVAVSDNEALAAFRGLAVSEGIVPALEAAHGLAFARRLSREQGRGGWSS